MLRVLFVIAAIHPFCAYGQEDPAAHELTPEERIAQALEQPADFEFVETPLIHIAESLAKKYEINLSVDEQSVEDAGVGADTPVTFSAQGITLRSALHLMLEPADLTTILQHETLRIVSRDTAENTLSTVVYDVHHLLRQDSPANTAGDLDELVDAIVGLSRYTSSDWEPGSIGVYRAGSAIVISQTEAMHGRIQQLLAQLRDPRQAAAPTEENEHTPAVRIEQALDRRADFDFSQVPLKEVAASLQRQFKIGIWIDARSLEDLGTGDDMHVTLHANGITLRSALNLMLVPLEMAAIVDHEMLQITSRDTTPTTVVYDAYDLVRHESEDIALDDLVDLVELIFTCVEPDSWPEGTGQGPIRIFRARSSLIIPQTQDVHRQIEDLLAQLRTTRQAHLASATAPNPAALVLRVYRVTPPADEAATSSAGAWEMSLSDALQEMVAPETWQKSGGTGAIAAIPGALFVRQTAAVHRDVAEALANFLALPQYDLGYPRGDHPVAP